MENKLHIESIQNQFGSKLTFSSSDLTKLYRFFEPEVKTATVNWRIYILVQEGILKRIGRGKFTLKKGDDFIPDLSGKMISLYKKIKLDFPYLTVCLWSTSVFSEFMLHQPGKYYQLLEVDKDAVERIFYYLKDRKYSVYMEPSEELIRRYIVDKKEPWIVKSLISEAPIQFVNNIPTVTIEKLLVDVFCDSLIFDAQQGSEMNYIFREAFEKYVINESKMLRYASRRRKKKELENYLNSRSLNR